jgi:hypothetical protein
MQVATTTAEGIYKGRRKNVDDTEIRNRIAAGATKAAVARDLNVSRGPLVFNCKSFQLALIPNPSQRS